MEVPSVKASSSSEADTTVSTVQDILPLRPSPTPSPTETAAAEIARCTAFPAELESWRNAVAAIEKLGFRSEQDARAVLASAVPKTLIREFISAASAAKLSAEDARWVVLSPMVRRLAGAGSVDALDLLAGITIVIDPPVVDGAMPSIRFAADRDTQLFLSAHLAVASDARSLHNFACLLFATEQDKAKTVPIAASYFKRASEAGYAPSTSMLAALSILRASAATPKPQSERQSLVSEALKDAKEAADRSDPHGMYLYGLGLQMWRPSQRAEAQTWMRRSAHQAFAPAVEWCRREGVPIP